MPAETGGKAGPEHTASAQQLPEQLPSASVQASAALQLAYLLQQLLLSLTFVVGL